MRRPYIICHMVMSIDGKVTGDYLFRPECEKTTEIYYEINRAFQSNGFVCGRVTMEGSFTNGFYPDLTKYRPIETYADYIPESLSGFYAVAFDPKGKLGWKSNRIIDEDPGYGNAQIIEVLTKQADPRYLSYLQELHIPYLFAGQTEIDAELALHKLKNLGADTLLLEGGSIVNGYFERADLIDELSLVIAPTIADAEAKPLFMDSKIADFTLKGIKQFDHDVIWMNYKRN